MTRYEASRQDNFCLQTDGYRANVQYKPVSKLSSSKKSKAQNGQSALRRRRLADVSAVSLCRWLKDGDAIATALDEGRSHAAGGGVGTGKTLLAR